MTNISIPITDNGDQCQSEYRVEYKLTGDTGYTVAPGIFTTTPIVIYNLVTGSAYNVRITRFCCDAQVSPPLEMTVTAGLETPQNFTATPFAGEEIQLVWDDDPNATTFVLERALDAAFTSSLTTVYSGAYTAAVVDAPLTDGVTYYYRIHSEAAGFPNSSYSYANATAFI